MTDSRMEVVQQNSEQLKIAGKQLEAAFGAFTAAQNAECEAISNLEESYRKAFASGFVIERVVDLKGLKYFAGMTEGNIFNPEDTGSECNLVLDRTHAQSLEGVFASRAVINFSRPHWRSEEDLRQHKSQRTPWLSFEVAGVYGNAEVGARIHRGAWMGENTEYTGSLDAIQWRLPTEEEIEKYASPKEAPSATQVV